MPEIDLRLCFFPVAQGLLQLWLLLVSPKGIMAMAGDGTGTFSWLLLEVAQGASHGWRWHGDLLVAMAPATLATSPGQCGQPWLVGSGRGAAFPRVPRGCGEQSLGSRGRGQGRL